MTAGKIDLIIEQGATFSRTLTWKDDNNTAINLTGYTARMHLREHLSASAPLVVLTTENGGITLTAAQGKLTLTLTATVTAALAVNDGVYDLEVVSASGVVTRLLQGKFIVERSVTR